MNTKKAMTMKISELESELNTNAKTGLSDGAYLANVAEFGKNTHEKPKRKGFFSVFLSQFADTLIVILLISAVISFVIAVNSDSKSDLVEPLIIVAIVLLNALLGASQQSRAERSLDLLSAASSPKAKVVRNGKTVETDGENLTVGDLVLLEAGDMVPADCRIVSALSLKVNESSLTGESLPVDKVSDRVLLPDTPLSKRSNCLFGGTFVTNGSATALVYAVASQTETGKISDMLSSTDETEIPLKRKLNGLSAWIGKVCLVVCAVVFVLGVVKGRKTEQNLGKNILEMFVTSVSLAVAAIPEGLPAVVTIVLSGGVEKMAKKNAIVKTLSAVETLGSAEVICTDKTGTLTQNKMTVVSVAVDGKEYLPQSTKAQTLLKTASVCCTVVSSPDGVIGDPIEIAITNAVGIDDTPKLFSLPFDSERKMMSVVVKDGDGCLLITKGAFDVMNKLASNGNEYADICRKMSRRGLRVIAVATKALPLSFAKSSAIENNFYVVGLIGVSDPPRAEAKNSVETCKKAGIRPVMITGDSPETAKEIAVELGICDQNGKVLCGNEVEQMTDEQLAEICLDVFVYARVSPSDKLRIVKAWQSHGKIVAMTGDGVNDSPALKKADIGCAMGSGTDVAKNTADIILTDDNFATIVDAVAEGRGVYDNILKSVRYLLSCNIGEVLSVFVSILLWNASPLVPMQLLWMNLVTDGLPSLALGMEKRESDVMERAPTNPNSSIVSKSNVRSICFSGVLFAIITVVAYAVGVRQSVTVANTMAFCVLSLSQLVFALEVRSNRSVFQSGFSPFTFVAVAISTALIAVVMLIKPLANVFSLATLSLPLLADVILLSLVPTVATELTYLFRKKEK